MCRCSTESTIPRTYPTEAVCWLPGTYLPDISYTYLIVLRSPSSIFFASTRSAMSRLMDRAFF